MAAHGIPYVAQASIYRWRDLMVKVRKAVAVDGPSFINIYAPCNRGWRIDTADALEYGDWKLNYKPREKKPVEAWLETEGRFKHLFKPEYRYMIEELQEEVDRRWERLLVRTESD